MRLAASTCRLALSHARSQEHRIHTLISLGSASLEMRDWARADEAYSEAERLLGSTGGAEALRVGSLRALATFLRGDFAAARQQMMPFLDRHMPERLADLDSGSNRHDRDGLREPCGSTSAFQERARDHRASWLHTCKVVDCGQLGHVSGMHRADRTRATPIATGLYGAEGRSVDAGALPQPHWHVVPAAERLGSGRSYYNAACDASVDRDPYAYLNSRTNRTLVHAGARDRAVAHLSAIGDEAVAAGLQFVEHKAALFRAILLHDSGRTDEAVSVLGSCVPEQMRLGHINFLGQEMTLQPELLSSVSRRVPEQGSCGDDFWASSAATGTVP